MFILISPCSFTCSVIHSRIQDSLEEFDLKKKCEESGKKRATSTGEILDQCEQHREEKQEKKKS